MASPYRDLCAKLLLFSEEAGEICMNESLWPKSDPNCTLLDRARALLDQPEQFIQMDPGRIQRGNGIGGITTPKPAIIPKGQRHYAALAQPKPEEPTDDKLMDIARATDLVYYMGKDCGFASPYMEETDITAEVLAFARAVLARYGGSTSSPTEA